MARGLHPYLAMIARRVPHVARAYGFNAKVTSGYRSYAKQNQLYQSWLRGGNPYPASPPGRSSHERGVALDVWSDNLPMLVALLEAAGLKWYGPKDPVHFSIPGL